MLTCSWVGIRRWGLHPPQSVLYHYVGGPAALQHPGASQGAQEALGLTEAVVPRRGERASSKEPR